jgi:hypothetical protein
LTLIFTVAAIALFSAGVAAAAGGWQPGGDDLVSPDSVASPVTEGTDGVTSTDSPEASEPDDPETSDSTEVAKEHPDNFGGTISSMRHEGDHTPAAIVKDPTKKVPGYTKKTTTTTETVAPTVPELTPETTIETPPTS